MRAWCHPRLRGDDDCVDQWESISVGDVDLETEVMGEGQPVVIIQTALTADELRPLAEQVARSARVSGDPLSPSRVRRQRAVARPGLGERRRVRLSSASSGASRSGRLMWWEQATAPPSLSVSPQQLQAQFAR